MLVARLSSYEGTVLPRRRPVLASNFLVGVRSERGNIDKIEYCGDPVSEVSSSGGLSAAADMGVPWKRGDIAAICVAFFLTLTLAATWAGVPGLRDVTDDVRRWLCGGVLSLLSGVLLRWGWRAFLQDWALGCAWKLREWAWVLLGPPPKTNSDSETVGDGESPDSPDTGTSAVPGSPPSTP